jgi:probable F420-dependent oxidoreductase
MSSREDSLNAFAGVASLGLLSHSTDRTPPIYEVARDVEDHGLASIFVCEHTHIPVGAPSVSPRGVLPDWTKHIPDPYVSLAFAAARTNLEIGTAVALVAESDPIISAKTVATLDWLSGGRLVLGVGWGWHREEFEDHTGLPANKRVPVLREKLALMREVWENDEAEYQGDYVRMPRSWSWPKPAQEGGPPILLGVQAGQRNFDRIAAWADGWIPMGNPLTDDDFPQQLAQLRATWEAAGRDPAKLDLTVLQPPAPPDGIRRLMDEADRFGVRRVLLQVWEGEAHILPEVLDNAGAGLAGR